MRLFFTSLFIFFLFNLTAQTCLLVDVQSEEPTCSGDIDGSITLSTTSGTAPYSYSLNNGVTFQSDGVFTGLGSGCYDLYVVDASGCDFTQNFCLSEPDPIYAYLPLVEYTYCDETDQNIVGGVDIEGGVPPYSYYWTTGETTATGTLTGGQEEYWTITDAVGCSTEPIRFAASRIIQHQFEVDHICAAGGAGSISLSANAGGEPVLINWSTGATGSTVDNLPAGTYYVTMSEFYYFQCIIVDSVEVIGVQTGLMLETEVTQPTCSSAGQITSSVSGGSTPYSYLWNTGATTSSIEQLGGGDYSLTLTDNTGCSIVENLTLSSPLDFTFTQVAPACEMSDGSITAMVSGGQAPYTYAWSNGATTANITGIPTGWYSLTVTSTNCTTHQNIYLGQPSDCLAEISGYVYSDTDCTSDPLTVSLSNRLLVLADQTTQYYAFTDSTGRYEFLVDAGNYDLSLVTNASDQSLCPAQSTTSVNAAVVDAVYPQDFFISIPETELVVAITKGPARPGFGQYHTISYRNEGLTTMDDVIITFTHDEMYEDFTTGTPATSYNPSSFTATWEVGSLAAGDFGNIYVNMRVPVSTQLGSSLVSTASVSPTDDLPANNSMTVYSTVTGSFDPNDKQNFAAPSSFGGDISPDVEQYHYHIRFQNTGTDTAFTVVVKDELDANLDWSTIRPVAASHDYSMDFEGNNTLVFFFEDIMLPDSNVNEPLSHGFVSFTVNRLPNLPLGTEISNTAAIYFDFNAPVITNTVVNTLAEPDGTIEKEQPNFNFSVNPNPLQGAAFVDLLLEKKSTITVRILDIHGRQLFIEQHGFLTAGHYMLNLDYERLAAGIYFVEVETETGFMTRKVVR